MSQARKQIRLNAFDMNCVGHISHGMWTHPRDRSAHYTDIAYWQHLARTLERGLFDGLFIADIIGLYDVYKGGPETALITGAQTPLNDPILLAPIMAAVTEHLGFGITVNLTYEQPYLFARRFSTLDHLTKGRIGWNIVTGYLDSAARGLGQDKLQNHDGRYDVADEFMEVVYKLWEGSWEDDAVLRDRERRIFTDPSKVHRISHRGPHYQVDGIHLSEPSPQRTPLLYQAGSSDRGRRFAGEHAECVFVNGPSRAITRSVVEDIRRKAVAAGRRPDDVKAFVGVTVIVAPTEAEAQDLFAEYREHASADGGLAHFSASVGLDFAAYDPDEPISFVKNDANNSALEAITKRSPDKVWTVRALREQMKLGSRNQPIVGSPSQVADQLAAWVEEADVDGFNLTRTVTPESVEAFVDLVVPELQDRGLYKTAYEEGPLRQKLFGAPRLPDRHRAAQFRRSWPAAAE
ncbi:LLM class flavin-dependent oxidoreductase [Bosea sp. 685]|uniref:LLM class flavin-dependent oxidoreductase n=1 Tax=Bosea sp. 685 TaxID=3080057 RepID=UPI002892BF7A|nr:LLM class flavin-dependent oxidoreductase [Bosea sp. 685]WNJ93800.1 LLM class flavin-dependent oxidoreductase [Bosea sp. 685]